MRQAYMRIHASINVLMQYDIRAYSLTHYHNPPTKQNAVARLCDLTVQPSNPTATSMPGINIVMADLATSGPTCNTDRDTQIVSYAKRRSPRCLSKYYHCNDGLRQFLGSFLPLCICWPPQKYRFWHDGLQNKIVMCSIHGAFVRLHVSWPIWSMGVSSSCNQLFHIRLMKLSASDD